MKYMSECEINLKRMNKKVESLTVFKGVFSANINETLYYFFYGQHEKNTSKVAFVRYDSNPSGQIPSRKK